LNRTSWQSRSLVAVSPFSLHIPFGKAFCSPKSSAANDSRQAWQCRQNKEKVTMTQGKKSPVVGLSDPLDFH